MFYNEYEQHSKENYEFLAVRLNYVLQCRRNAERKLLFFLVFFFFFFCFLLLSLQLHRKFINFLLKYFIFCALIVISLVFCYLNYTGRQDFQYRNQNIHSYKVLVGWIRARPQSCSISLVYQIGFRHVFDVWCGFRCYLFIYKFGCPVLLLC